MDKAEEKNVKIHLPVDFVVADKMTDDAQACLATLEEGIQDNMSGYDIGLKSRESMGGVIERAKTLVWNGPPGVFEFKPFQCGTQHFMEKVIEATKRGCTTIIGGGDTATVAKKWKATDKVSHVSTGGGASLELLEGSSFTFSVKKIPVPFPSLS